MRCSETNQSPLFLVFPIQKNGRQQGTKLPASFIILMLEIFSCRRFSRR